MKMPLDKQAHFWAGMAIMLALSLFAGWVVGLVLAVAAGAIKEGIDALGFGTPDPWDLWATALGAVAGTVLYLIAGAM